ncbi:hypothetical protein [Deinococcus humi]|uniref:Uncharacterized protein n=1 Tax=Deinococcus humi TaxID=662880 RepID=A0A7W8NFU8_9DEIO|nr:hypothetical protein [Deinococcus humi]MBB5365834.1 hypothetical protein [Deinococcus humi]
MNQPASRSSELNTPEQQREAATLLQWPWSAQATHALTTYFRCMEDVNTPEQLADVLTETLGHAPPVLLDVQRELGGITLHDRGAHTLHLCLDSISSIETGWDEGMWLLPLAWRDVAVPDWNIRLDGQVDDGPFLYANARLCVEWHVIHRSLFNQERTCPVYSQSVEVRGKPFEALRSSLTVLAEFLDMDLAPLLSDSWNLLWLSEHAELTVQHDVKGVTHARLTTEHLEAAETFSDWCHTYGTSVWDRKRIEPHTADAG